MTTTIIDSTITIAFNQTSNTICSGFFDINGIWNNGFICPIENSIQYFCCGINTYRYCCSPDRYRLETKFDIDSNSIVDYSSIYDNILHNDISSALINNRKLISKQFDQFQRYFFPVFLLSTTVLFLVGIALWFWLYKHKVFYSIGEDDLMELRTIHNTNINSIPRTKENYNLNTEQQSRPTTEV